MNTSVLTKRLLNLKEIQNENNFFMEFPINIDQQTLKLKSTLKTWGKLLTKSVALIVLLL